MIPRHASFDPAAMQRLLDGEQAAVRARVRAVLSRPSFRYHEGNDIPAFRETVLRWCRELAAEGFGSLAVPQKFGGEGDFAKFMAAFETIAFHDISLTIKFTVQCGIWLGSVQLLGNEEQQRRWLPAIGSFELPGCFAMTEIGHGSNVRELETVARYEPVSAEFVINSPTWTSGKNYIGNGACHGHAATVFAQLEIDDRHEGIHAFLVPLRDERNELLPGVRVEDNGPKMGENGVDNARIWFDHVRVPREALLDRYGGVSANGTYASPIASPTARFFAMISALVGGRISIAAAALSAARSGLTIAVRYAANRRQFRAPGAAEDTPLLDYPTHRRRLLPLVANAYALDFALKNLVCRRANGLAGQGDTAAQRTLESLAAGFKAFASWNTTHTLQTCRETCGGEGYMSVNRLPSLKADSDIFTTFEGDNTVLMLWVGRNLLSLARKEPRIKAVSPPDRLNSREALGGLFAWRVRRMTDDLLAAGEDDSATRQMALFHLAQAWIENFLVETFAQGIAACPDPALLPVLAGLHELFALALLEKHRGWFLENEALLPAGSKVLAPRVDALCARLAPDAVALVDAFGIPDQCVAAPIALGAAASPSLPVAGLAERS